MLKPPSPDPLYGMHDEEQLIDFSDVDIRLPMLVYMSREKRPGYDHNKKAGAMNALVRCSAVMSNGPFILNFDCDHYINYAQAIREAMCFVMDRGGERIAYIQFPQRFEGIDPSDRYANHNTVFFDGNMRALDGLQGPMYVGTGCMFRRFALYGFDPPRTTEYTGWLFKKKKVTTFGKADQGETDTQSLNSKGAEDFDAELTSMLVPRRFGNSSALMASIPVAEFQARPLADHPAVLHGRPPGSLTVPRPPLDPPTVAEAVSVISCWYEDKTEWGDRVGWIYGSVTEDVVSGYRMHNRGWRSVYCIPKRDAFLGTAPINLTDRLHQVLRWATGSVEIFFSRNNAFLASRRLMFLQRVAYLNVGIYPFTSIFLLVYCFIPALSLFSGFFIVQTLNVAFLCYLLTITVTLIALGVLYLVFSPTNSDLNLVLSMPRVHVVFNDEPVRKVAPVAAAPAPGNATDDDEDSGLPPPRQLTDPPYSLGRAILDYDARRSAWLAAHPELPARVGQRPRVLVVTGSAPARCPTRTATTCCCGRSRTRRTTAASTASTSSTATRCSTPSCRGSGPSCRCCGR